jgi:ABC-type glycerol-3-phosphate transport system substrate-binding protein
MNFALKAQPFVVQCSELRGKNLKQDFQDLYAIYATPCTKDAVSMYFQDPSDVLSRYKIDSYRDIDDLINMSVKDLYWNKEIFEKYIKRTVR